MTKYSAKVSTVLRHGLHRVAHVSDAGSPIVTETFPDAEVVEIEVGSDGEGPCFLYRYTGKRVLCGDTWHVTLADAFQQARFEYGLEKEDFRLTE